MKPVRVVHVIDHLGLGGAQATLVRLLPELRQRGVDVALLVLRGTSPHVDTLRQAGIEVRCLNLDLWDPSQVPRVARAIRQLAPDIVHASLFRAWLLSMVVGLVQPRFRLILHDYSGPAHDMKAPRWLQRAGRLMRRMFLARVSTYLCVSQANARYVEQVWRVPPVKIRVAYNPFVEPQIAAEDRTSVRAELGLAADQQVVLAAGRFSPEKGFDVLIDAAGELAHTAAAPVVLLAGDGPLRAELEAHIARLRLHEHVRLLGQRSDIPRLLAAADLFVQPSRSESMPVAVLEAMSAGVAVIGSDVGGIPELLDKTGVLVPAGDHQALARAIAHLLADHNVRQSLGAAARQRVREHFSSARAIKQILACYEAVYAR